jgi:hypothetical protein
MSLKGRLRRVAREVEGDGIVLRLKDGTTRVFDAMEVNAQMFLAQMNLFTTSGPRIDNEVLEAVRGATPESRQAFEERFGPIAMSGHVISAEWVEVYTLDEDGAVEKVRHEGASEEAIRIREGAKASPGGAAY